MSMPKYLRKGVIPELSGDPQLDKTLRHVTQVTQEKWVKKWPVEWVKPNLQQAMRLRMMFSTYGESAHWGDYYSRQLNKFSKEKRIQ